MSDSKYTLPIFDGKLDSDFQLWYCRLAAILKDKNLGQLFEADTAETSTAVSVATDEARSVGNANIRKASAIIINALGNKPLRLVASSKHTPFLMMKKLKERYASTNLSTRMLLMTELCGKMYQSNKDMGDYVDGYASLLNRLAAMGAKIPDDLYVIMFLHSMNGSFESTVAALRTMKKDDIKWDDVTSRLIEESTIARSRHRHESALAASSSRPSCIFCKKRGHSAFQCWNNPENPHNRLQSDYDNSDDERHQAKDFFSTTCSCKKGQPCRRCG